MDTTVIHTNNTHPESESLLDGTELQGGRYRIICTLGRGGFGITYLALQVIADRLVCIKEFFPKGYYNRAINSCSITLASQSNVEMMDRYKLKFIKEARTLAQFKHPNIVRIFDIFEENDTAYYVMEYIEGGSMSQLVARKGALSEDLATKYMLLVASAVSYIHNRKVMHFDIKPANIMISSDDDSPMLIDFGLSKHYDSSGQQTSTTPLGISHGFAPIEQYQEGGVAEFSPCTDIYSMGATLYYLVMGKVPPTAAIVGEDGLGELPSRLSKGVRDVIYGAMRYRRKDRIQTASDFLSMLNARTITSMGDGDTIPIILQPVTDKTYKVGDYYKENGKEGVVFEVSDGGRHGKIVSLDQAEKPWDARVKRSLISYSRSSGEKIYTNDVNDGMVNSKKVYGRLDKIYFDAFMWCQEKGDGWYLPAVNEIRSIYSNASVVEETLKRYDAHLLSSYYWSSTEFFDNSECCAWRVTRNKGLYADGKCEHNAVRAVAQF